MVYERLSDDISGIRVAAIDATDDRTKAAFAVSRTAAWHELGTLVPDDFSVEQGLELAHMTAPVVKVPLTATMPTADGVTTMTIPDKVALMDTDPFTGTARYLNTVGSDYGIVQAKELGDWGHAFLGVQGGSQLTSLGTWDGGKNVFMSLRLPQSVKIDGQDRQDFYLGLVNRHGGGALTAVTTALRFECRNTTTAGLAAADARINLRHTSGIITQMQRIEEARRVLRLTVDYIGEFEALMNTLVHTPITKATIESMVKVIFPKPAEDASIRTRNGWDRKFEAIVAEWEAPHNEFGKDTAYGAWNALTSWENYEAPVRIKGATDAQRQVARAENVVNGDTDKVTEKALRYLLTV